MNSDLIAAILAYFKVTEWSAAENDWKQSQAHRCCPDCSNTEWAGHDYQCPRDGLMKILEGLLNENST